MKLNKEDSLVLRDFEDDYIIVRDWMNRVQSPKAKEALIKLAYLMIVAQHNVKFGRASDNLDI